MCWKGKAMTSPTDYASLTKELDTYRKTDPARFLKTLAGAQNITDPELRFLRAEALHTLATNLHQALRTCDFRNEIVVRPEGVFVDIGGILMESSRTDIYLKSSGGPCKNQAEHLSQVLARMNINIATAVDVGANFGEISLWLAREYREARIVAIEPSSDNLAVFELNRKVQSFPTGRIELIQKAVTDKAGVAALSRGVSTMNRVMAESGSERAEPVSCDSLDALFDSHAIRTADFVKIDIEGSEPKLREALVALRERVRSYYIEFSQFAPLDDYLALASTLLAQRFACYDETASSRLGTLEDIARHLRTAFAPSPIAATNLWFIAERAKPANGV